MGLDTGSDCGSTKNLGVVSRVADYAQKPALHEGRGMIGRSRRQRTSRQSVPLKFVAALGKPTHHGRGCLAGKPHEAPIHALSATRKP
jgi:hypothetical protein